MTASASPSDTTRPPLRRRSLSIEEALRWAIRDELPKLRDDHGHGASLSGSIHPMWRSVAFGGRIDNWSREPGFPAAMGDPHPDALVIRDQLDALSDLLRRAALGSCPCPLDLSPYGIETELRGPGASLDVILSNALDATPAWLVTSAIKGSRPDVGGAPVCEAATSENGKITLWRTVSSPAGTGQDGKPWFITSEERTAPTRAGCYVPGTYTKLAWPRPGVEVVEEQVRYALWHAALVYLVPALQFLTSLEVLPPRSPTCPWLELPEIVVAPLPSLRPVRRVDLSQRRPSGRRTVRRTASPSTQMDQAGQATPARSA